MYLMPPIGNKETIKTIAIIGDENQKIPSMS